MLDNDANDKQNNDVEGTEEIYTLEQLRALEPGAVDSEEPVPERSIDYPIINFFRGSVSQDRMQHESNAQHGGMAHWRHNTSARRDHDSESCRQVLMHVDVMTQNLNVR